MSPFQPKGSRALRVIVVELAAARSYGEVVTYTDLAQAIDVAEDDAGRAQVRQVVSAARPVLLRDHQKALVPVRGKGYRVANPGEFAGIAQDYRRRSDRAVGKALAVIDNAPESDMSPEERKRHQAVKVVIHNLAARMTSTEQRIADLEDTVHELLYGPPSPIISGKVEP